MSKSKPIANRTLVAALPLVGALMLAPGVLPANARGPVPGDVDLSIDKSDNADPIAETAQITYTLEVANGGPDTANGVTVTDNLPNDLDFVSVESSQGNCTNQNRKVTCELGAIESGASATVTIAATPKRDGQISNTATVETTDNDTAAGNNSDTETTTVTPAAAAAMCGGREATIVGSPTDDVLTGTKKADVIDAGTGSDRILGAEGNDVICARGGNDFAKGQEGGDTVRGGGGEDRVRGNADNDNLRGGGGNDAIGGGPGNDAMNGGAGNDVCRGGPGSDTKKKC